MLCGVVGSVLLFITAFPLSHRNCLKCIFFQMLKFLNWIALVFLWPSQQNKCFNKTSACWYLCWAGKLVVLYSTKKKQNTTTCNNRFSMITLILKWKGGTILLKRTIHVIIIPAVNKYVPPVVRQGCLHVHVFELK